MLKPDKVAYVVKHFATTPNKELAKAIGASCSTITNIARRYKLKKTKEHMHEMHIYTGTCTSHKFTSDLQPDDDAVRRRSQSWLKRYREERARRIFGLPQKTRIRIKVEPKAKTGQRTYLKSRGYVMTKHVAYYTDETRRSPRVEKTTKYFTFQPLCLTPNAGDKGAVG